MAEAVRYMRVMVFFDLPVKTEVQRSRAGRFRRILLNNGFHMIQYSIYSRACRGEDGVKKYGDRIRNQVPSEGHVRIMSITDKQFARMEILIGKTSREEEIGSKQLLLF